MCSFCMSSMLPMVRSVSDTRASESSVAAERTHARHLPQVHVTVDELSVVAVNHRGAIGSREHVRGVLVRNVRRVMGCVPRESFFTSSIPPVISSASPRARTAVRRPTRREDTASLERAQQHRARMAAPSPCASGAVESSRRSGMDSVFASSTRAPPRTSSRTHPGIRQRRAVQARNLLAQFSARHLAKQMILRAGVHGVARGARGEGHERAPGHGDEDLRSISGGAVTEAPSRGSIARDARRSRRPPTPRPATSPARCTRRRRCTRRGSPRRHRNPEFRLFQFVVVVHGEDACLAEERHHRYLSRRRRRMGGDSSSPSRREAQSPPARGCPRRFERRAGIRPAGRRAVTTWPWPCRSRSTTEKSTMGPRLVKLSAPPRIRRPPPRAGASRAAARADNRRTPSRRTPRRYPDTTASSRWTCSRAVPA